MIGLGLDRERRNHLTWAEVDLEAIGANVRALKRRLGNGVDLMGVVKANGYGHGAAWVAREALANGASSLAVARPMEGFCLRQAGIKAPILILGACRPADAAAIVGWDLTPTVTTVEAAETLSVEAQKRGCQLAVQVKVDTGMGRFGLMPHEVVGFVARLSQMPHLRFAALWSHLACADEADKTHALWHFEDYVAVVRRVEAQGIPIPLRHLGDSAVALDLPDMYLDLVRVGLCLYGLYPSPDVSHDLPLRPAMSLHSRLARVADLPAGHCVSYGCTYRTTRTTRVGLVAMGYGDGYPRALSNRGAVLVNGRRAPIRGLVCLDQLVVELPDATNDHIGDEVVLLGCQGQDEITADELAAVAGTLSYEIVTAIAPRVTRIYRRGSELVGCEALCQLALDAGKDRR